MRRARPAALTTILLLLAAVPQQGGPAAAERAIDVTFLRAHLVYLAHDRLQGRAPGTAGADMAARYIAGHFERAGLEPAPGGWLQPVPLAGAVVRSGVLRHATARGEPGGAPTALQHPGDVVLWSGRPGPAAAAGSVLFAGYGIAAPAYDWNDFAGVEARGRVLLVLPGEPAAHPGEPRLFGGRALSYYGRWTYKVEEAARRGAAAVLLVHSADATGYDWDVVVSSWGRERLYPADHPPGAPPPAPVQGWIRHEAAAALLAGAGLDLDSLTRAAGSRGFRPAPTSITARLELDVTAREIAAANVVGWIPGHDPALRQEAVILTAHYDHLGIGPAVDGDSIYNGAYDNASGVAVLLETARAFGRLAPRPARSVVFVATTAEEAGLLGAEHYVRAPAVPARAVAALNVDGANLWGETDDVAAVGGERSTLGAALEEQARALGLRVAPERAASRGTFFRSDQFAFARAGVPAIALEHGLEYRSRPAGWGHTTLARFQQERYHRPADRFLPEYDLAGAAQQARLLFRVARAVAERPDPPAWLPGGRPDH
jgi:Zn-dependent M28 family amino/carboxypeptidase